MDAQITPAFVRDYLWNMAGIEIDLNEATRLVPYIRGTRVALERLYQFEVGHVRPAMLFNPAAPYEQIEGGTAND